MDSDLETTLHPIEWYISANTTYVVAFVIILVILHVNLLKFDLEILK